MSLAIVGTSTGIGKTVVSAVLMVKYARSYKLAYWKPIATGSSEGRDTVTVRALIGERGEILPETYLFAPPVSPHFAARMAKHRIDPDTVRDVYVAHARSLPKRALVVEGVGGLLVPITDEGLLLADLFARLRLPCLLVSSSELGTINHTLLSIEAMRGRKMTLAGVVLCGPKHAENLEAIERFGKTRVIAEVEPLAELTPAAVRRAAQRFDRDGVLRRYLVSGGRLP